MNILKLLMKCFSFYVLVVARGDICNNIMPLQESGSLKS